MSTTATKDFRKEKLTDPKMRFLLACVALFLEPRDALEIRNLLSYNKFLGRRWLQFNHDMGRCETWPISRFSNSSAVAKLFADFIRGGTGRLCLPDSHHPFALETSHLHAMIAAKALVTSQSFDGFVTSADLKIIALRDFMRTFTGVKGDHYLNLFPRLLGMARYGAWPEGPPFPELPVRPRNFNDFFTGVNKAYRGED